MPYEANQVIWRNGDELRIIDDAPDRDGFQRAVRIVDGKQLVVLSPEAKAERVAQWQREWKEQQAAFSRLARRQAR